MIEPGIEETQLLLVMDFIFKKILSTLFEKLHDKVVDISICTRPVFYISVEG